MMHDDDFTSETPTATLILSEQDARVHALASESALSQLSRIERGIATIGTGAITED